MKRRLHMVYEKRHIISYIERFPFPPTEIGLLRRVFLSGLHGQDFSQPFFCVYRSNSLVGGQGVGAEQTFALGCMREHMVLSLVLGCSMRVGYWSERVI